MKKEVRSEILRHYPEIMQYPVSMQEQLIGRFEKEIVGGAI